MIPHPLTLLFCWLFGMGLSDALGYVLQFVGELFADAQRYGWIGSGVAAMAFVGLSVLGSFAGGFFTGAAMRLLAEKSWPRAAFWAFSAVFLAALVGSSAPLSLYPAASAAILSSPRFFLGAPAGCLLGAYWCGRFRGEPWLDAAEGFLRNWMFWERGGAR